MVDGRDAQYGDYGTKSTMSGKITTGHELDQAGVGVFDTAWEADDKVAKFRAPAMLGQTTPMVYSSGGPDGLSAGVAVIAFTFVIVISVSQWYPDGIGGLVTTVQKMFREVPRDP